MIEVFKVSKEQLQVKVEQTEHEFKRKYGQKGATGSNGLAGNANHHLKWFRSNIVVDTTGRALKKTVVEMVGQVDMLTQITY